MNIFFDEKEPTGLLKIVGDFLFDHCDIPDIEIEAKYGQIIDRNTNQRLNLPILSQTVLQDDSFIRFESNMSVNQHKRLNELFNNQVRLMKGKYSHVKQLDKFFWRDVKIRSSFVGGIFTESIVKTRIADLHIYCPEFPFDIRLSANREVKVQDVREGRLETERFKDRMSYEFGSIFPLQFDLTQVKQDSEKTHELELEIRDIGALCKEKSLLEAGEENRFDFFVSLFIANLNSIAVVIN